MHPLLKLFGFTPLQAESFVQAVEWVRKIGEQYGTPSEFEGIFLEQVQSYLKSSYSGDVTLIGEKLPTTKEGWISLVVEHATDPYAEYDEFQENIEWTQVDRKEWDTMDWKLRKIIESYFTEVIKRPNALEIRDEVERADKTLVYINGRLSS